MADATDLLEDDDEVVKAQVWDTVLLRRLLKFALPYWRRIVLGLVLAALSSGLAITPPLLVGALVDVVFLTGDGAPGRIVSRIAGALLPGTDAAGFAAFTAMNKLWVFAAIFLLVRVGSFFVDWANQYLLATLAQQTIYDIRMSVFSHIHGLDLAWFHKNPVGRMVTRVTNDVGALEEMFGVALVTVIKDLGMLIGISGTLLLVDLRLGLVAMGVIPPLTVATIIFRRVSRSAYRRWRAALSRLNAFLAENLEGIRIVKLFFKEKRNEAAYDEIGRDYMGHFLRQRRAWAVFRPVNTTLSAAGTGLVFWFGGARVLAKQITVGELVTFTSCVELFYAPIRDLTEKFDILQGAMTAAERIFRILDELSGLPESESPKEPGRLSGALEFRNVSFQYLEGEPVLRDVSFSVAPGETVAVVGHTGAGKTTLINLLTRFYDVGKGAVLADGIDVKDYRLKGLRENVAVVHQDVFLFAGTILENLRLGDEAVPEERVREAAAQVAADAFIEKLPGGYQATVEEGGKTFSAGERQLLSFARALVFDPSILVLDEATSSVDSKTEERIQAAIGALTRGRTSIVIAHRLSTIKNADRILVMDKGRLVETGNHAQLLARGGIYKKLYEMQFAGL